MPQITAQLNYLRIAPRKVRAVAGLLKGLDVDLAQAQLKYLTRSSARPLLKLLNSAMHNAQHNFGLNKDYLYIKEIIVNEGMKLKRFKPKGFSLVMPIQKKTSHIKIVLDELPEEKRKKKEEIVAKMPRVEAKPTEEKKKEIMTDKKEAKKPAFRALAEKETEKTPKRGAFGGIKTLGRKLFRRKAV